jgi:hypothetical protein
MRSKKLAYHYTNDVEKIKQLYSYQLSISKI